MLTSENISIADGATLGDEVVNIGGVTVVGVGEGNRLGNVLITNFEVEPIINFDGKLEKLESAGEDSELMDERSTKLDDEDSVLVGRC